MKAMLLREYGGPEKLDYVTDIPDPQIGDDEMLVVVTAASINPIDYKIRNGSAAARFPQTFPTILGRDLSGIVRAIGKNVRTFKPGDRVLAFTNHTFAELVAVKENEVAHLPDGVDIVKAAALPLAVLTGDQLVRRAAKVQPGQTVLVTGALGSVGRAAVHSAKKLGAYVIAGVRKHSLDAVKDIEADAAVAMDDDEAIAALGFVDAIADTVGGAATTKLLSKVKEGGIVGTVVTPPPDGSLHTSLEMNLIRTQPDASKLREFADDVRDGKFDLPIDRMIPLEDVAAGLTAVEKGGIGKVVVLVL
ncbi:MAG: NADP-dependent oxidoreductase [Acidobacteria bacterium]|nr:NADP-dependent oxidoreductase [Acidobacteriota bacterium]